MTGFWQQHQLGVFAFLTVLLAISLSNWLMLRRMDAFSPASRWPSVSVLLPVRDEVDNITEALSSLLAQEYPDFEVLVLDDHSTDGTASRLANFAAQNSRLKILPSRPLPDGWLGKHWACQQLAEAAAGELLLFTDADVRHDPQALRHAVSALDALNADLLSAFPRQQVVRWGERLVVPTLMFFFFSFFPTLVIHWLKWPPLALSIGQFMLFRRPAYFAVGGHEAVKSNPVDDIALSQRVKRLGLRVRLVDGGRLLRCRMYKSFGQAVEGFSKNLFAAFGFRVLLHIFVWAWVLLTLWQPLVLAGLHALHLLPADWPIWPSAVAAIEWVALWGLAMGRFRFPFYLLPLYPLNVTIFAGIAFRSMLLSLRGRATWKGRTLARQPVRWV